MGTNTLVIGKMVDAMAMEPITTGLREKYYDIFVLLLGNYLVMEIVMMENGGMMNG